jgi:hypothetical protein
MASRMRCGDSGRLSLTADTIAAGGPTAPSSPMPLAPKEVISHNPMAIRTLLVDLFVERAPRQIILDLDATDDPLHGEQEGRFFHGYYDCYCYLPLYVFCGRHLLVAKLRSAAMDAAAGAV